MKKNKLESVEEVVDDLKKISTPRLFNWSTVKTVVKLAEMVEEHGVVFIINPTGLPLKVTRAELT